MVHSNKQIHSFIFLFLPYSSIKYLPYLYKFRVRIMSSVLSSTCNNVLVTSWPTYISINSTTFYFACCGPNQCFEGPTQFHIAPHAKLLRPTQWTVIYSARWQLKIYILYRYIRWYRTLFLFIFVTCTGLFFLCFLLLFHFHFLRSSFIYFIFCSFMFICTNL